MAHYDVLMEPWIPAEKFDGTIENFGILDLLLRAPDLRRIACEAPLESYGVLRLLTAFLMDAYSLKGIQARQDLYQKGTFSKTVLKEYVRLCIGGGSSFDLFDEKRPFMQAWYDPAIDKVTKSPAALVHELPSGNNHIHFDHHLERECFLTPAEALRALCSAYVFCTAGLAGPSSVNNTPCIYTVCCGENLFQSLTLAMVSRGEMEAMNIPWDIPPVAWRDPDPVIPREQCSSVSVLGALTWRPRRVTLIPAEDGLVRQIYYTAGLDFRGNTSWKDPHVPYRKRSQKGKKAAASMPEWFSVKPQSGRALWRDVGSIIAARIDSTHRPPLILSQRSEVTGNDNGLVQVQMTGLVTNQAQYVNEQSDCLALPAVFFDRPDLGDFLQDEVSAVEGAASAILIAYRQLNPSVAEQLQAGFFARMHDVLFSDDIPLIAAADTSQYDCWKKLREHLNGLLRAAVIETMTEASQRLGIGARNLIRLTKSEDFCIKMFNSQIKQRSEPDGSE